MDTIGHTNLHGMSLQCVALKSPHLILTIAINDFSVSNSLFSWSKAEGFSCSASHTLALSCINCYVGSKTWLKLQFCVWCANHNLICHNVVGSSSLQTNLLYCTLESVVRISIYGESYAFANSNIAYISLVDICHNLHVCQVFGYGKEFRSTEACCHSLSFLYALRNYHAINRRCDGSIAKVSLCTLHLFLCRLHAL